MMSIRHVNDDSLCDYSNVDLKSTLFKGNSYQSISVFEKEKQKGTTNAKANLVAPKTLAFSIELFLLIIFVESNLLWFLNIWWLV